MKDKYIAQAPTQEEAVEKGLAALGITRDEAKIIVEEPGKKGFLGIGQKDAIVVVERKEKVDLVSDLLDEESLEGMLGQKDKASKVSVEEDKAEKSESEELPAAEEKVEKEAEPTEETEEKVEPEVSSADEGVADEEANDEEEVPAEIREAQQDQEAIDSIAQYLRDIIHGMGVTDAEVYTSRVDNQITYDIETEDAGLVIGRHGKVLNGLQTLAQNHMHQLAFNKLFVKVDAEKYRSRRQDTVEYLARKTADKVIKTGRLVSLNPMPAHERKQIHRYLHRYPEVTTYSEGKEPHRHLVVEPVEE